jgi:pimeloyl-ACP methyl ester carboxylesterase
LAALGLFDAALESRDLERELAEMLDAYTGWHWTHDNPAKVLEPPAAERLGELCVPALVVTGGRDLDYNEVVGKRLLEGIPHATALHLPRAGHMANMEEPDAVNRMIAMLADRAFKA